MELRHLRYFTAVAEARSFRRAAELLHVAQPPLSRQVRDLEEEIGAALLDRDRGGVRLTDAAGNTGLAGVSTAYVLDTTPPVGPVIKAPASPGRNTMPSWSGCTAASSMPATGNAPLHSPGFSADGWSSRSMRTRRCRERRMS